MEMALYHYTYEITLQYWSVQNLICVEKILLIACFNSEGYMCSQNSIMSDAIKAKYPETNNYLRSMHLESWLTHYSRPMTAIATESHGE